MSLSLILSHFFFFFKSDELLEESGGGMKRQDYSGRQVMDSGIDGKAIVLESVSVWLLDLGLWRRLYVIIVMYCLWFVSQALD